MNKFPIQFCYLITPYTKNTNAFAKFLAIIIAQHLTRKIAQQLLFRRTANENFLINNSALGQRV